MAGYFAIGKTFWIAFSPIIQKDFCPNNIHMAASTLISKIPENNTTPTDDNLLVNIAGKSSMCGNMPEMNMPYTTKLSFAPLLRFWEQKQDSEDVAEKTIAKEIMKRVKKHPELWDPIDDYAELTKYSDTVELLLSGLFPLNLRGKQMGRASRPFDMEPFFMTPGSQQLMDKGMLNIKIEKSAEFFTNTIIIKACATILNQHYGQNLEVDPTVVFTLLPEEGGTQRHFKSIMNIKFMDVVPTKPLKKLTQEDINDLLGNVYDASAWLEAIPPENFEIHGVVGMDLVDVTKEETVSRIRYKLLEKDAVVKKENVEEIEKLLQAYYGFPDLKMGIMALDFPPEKDEELKYNINHCFLHSFDRCDFEADAENSIYAKAARFQNMLLVEDLERLPNKTMVEEALISLGLRSVIIAPLVNKKGKIIGMVELGSPNPYELNSFAEFQFQNLLPLFSMAVERSREETDNIVEAVIREKFTAIHPSVEWRFSQAAFNYLNAEKVEGQRPPVERIAF